MVHTKFNRFVDNWCYESQIFNNFLLVTVFLQNDVTVPDGRLSAIQKQRVISIRRCRTSLQASRQLDTL